MLLGINEQTYGNLALLDLKTWRSHTILKRLAIETTF